MHLLSFSFSITDLKTFSRDVKMNFQCLITRVSREGHGAEVSGRKDGEKSNWKR